MTTRQKSFLTSTAATSLLSLLGVAIILPVAPSFAAEKAVEKAVEKSAATASGKDLPFTEDQRGAMEDFVRDFILNNPEVLMESVNRMNEKAQKKQNEDAQKVVEENRAFFYTDPSLPEAGNPKGDVTVIEFFDYNCGYCKHALDVVKKVVDNDKNVRVRFIDFPILSPQSETASKWALAAAKQGKYWEFHQAVMTSPAPKTEENLANIAKTVGLDVEKLKKDAASDEVKKEIERNKEMAQKLGINGTPGFIVGKEILRGFAEYDAFKTIIDKQRKGTGK